MNSLQNYLGYRFPPEIISHTVWLYHRFTLNFRDIEDLLAERNVIVSSESIRQWCARFRNVKLVKPESAMTTSKALTKRAQTRAWR